MNRSVMQIVKPRMICVTDRTASLPVDLLCVVFIGAGYHP